MEYSPGFYLSKSFKRAISAASKLKNFLYILFELRPVGWRDVDIGLVRFGEKGRVFHRVSESLAQYLLRQFQFLVR